MAFVTHPGSILYGKVLDDLTSDWVRAHTKTNRNYFVPGYSVCLISVINFRRHPLFKLGRGFCLRV